MASISRNSEDARRRTGGGWYQCRRPRAKWWWNLLQERLAVHVVGITHGDRVAPVAPGRIEDAMVAHDLTVAWHEWHHGYLHPHLGLVGRRE